MKRRGSYLTAAPCSPNSFSVAGLADRLAVSVGEGEESFTREGSFNSLTGERIEEEPAGRQYPSDEEEEEVRCARLASPMMGAQAHPRARPTARRRAVCTATHPTPACRAHCHPTPCRRAVRACAAWRDTCAARRDASAELPLCDPHTWQGPFLDAEERVEGGNGPHSVLRAVAISDRQRGADALAAPGAGIDAAGDGQTDGQPLPSWSNPGSRPDSPPKR